MKYFLLLLLFAGYFGPCFGQEARVYVTKDGKYSGDPKNAVLFLLVNEVKADTGYAFKQYNMHDTIMLSGYYADKLLSIPNGKFVYYRKNFPSKPRPGSSNSIDTENYIQTIGHFSNGKRVGIWTEYSGKDIKSAIFTYKNDVLDGLYEEYFNDYSGFWIRGTMKDNLKEGMVYKYNADSLLLSESQYLNNKLVRTETYWVEAKPPEDFTEELEAKMIKYQVILSQSHAPAVRFTIDKTGKILNPSIISGVNPKVDSALIRAIINTKNYFPATYKGAPVQQDISEIIILFDEKERDKALKIISDGMKSQGRSVRSGNNH
jgi:hypothetical protein